MDNNSIRFAGDVNVEKVIITSNNGMTVDVKNQIIGIEIYEDIFSPFTSGSLIFKESLDYANLIPLTGEEYLHLKIRTPSFEGKDKVIEGDYYLYKMTDRELQGDRNVIYKLHFVSVEALVDLNKKVSKAFQGKISDIAKKMVTDINDGLESKQNVIVQETPNSVKYISNFWSPVKNLNYLCGNAVNNRDGASYVFFQNRNGFNFVSLESLYYNENKQNFIFDSWLRDFTPDGKNVRNVEKEYQRIIDINIPNAYDQIDSIRSGMGASKLITYDITTKRYASKNYDMLTEFYSHNHLNQYPLISKKNVRKSFSNIVVGTKYYNNFSKYGDVTNTRIMNKRMSELRQAEGVKIEITVAGRTDYTAGMKVGVRLNKNEPISKQDTDYYDKMFSGNYIVAAVNHFISRENHECTMELIKDSYTVNLDNGGRTQ